MVKYHSTGWFRDMIVPKDAGRYLGEFPGTPGLGMAKHHMFQYLHKTESLVTQTMCLGQMRTGERRVAFRQRMSATNLPWDRQ